MEDNKRVTILVTIALILAITAIALSAMDSDEIPTSKPSIQDQAGSGLVGIDIQQNPVEDKLTEETPQQ